MSKGSIAVAQLALSTTVVIAVALTTKHWLQTTYKGRVAPGTYIAREVQCMSDKASGNLLDALLLKSLQYMILFLNLHEL